MLPFIKCNQNNKFVLKDMEYDENLYICDFINYMYSLMLDSISV